MTLPTNHQYTPGDRIALVYFPGVTGTVDRVNEDGRIWVVFDRNVFGYTAGVPTPIARYEMNPLHH